MHRIVAHAHLVPSAGADRLDTPALAAMLRDGWSTSRDELEGDALSTPIERAWARAHGVDVVDGLVPIARAFMHADAIESDPAPWALVTPVHARVSLDHVTVEAPRDVGVDDVESRALFDAVQPWFADDGHHLVYGHAHRWYVSHAGLATLATASIERTGGEGIERWLPRGSHARRWQRLQNEAQMLMHTHPVNEAREARGVKPINSLWLSGTGAVVDLRDDVSIDERLDDAVDEASLHAAWVALDRDMIAPLAASAGDAKLTLCGPRASVTLSRPPRRGWWQRLSRQAASDVATLLRGL